MRAMHASTCHHPLRQTRGAWGVFYGQNLSIDISSKASGGGAIVGVAYLIWFAAVWWQWKFFLLFFSLICLSVRVESLKNQLCPPICICFKIDSYFFLFLFVFILVIIEVFFYFNFIPRHFISFNFFLSYCCFFFLELF